jgi:hypothetical protein
MAALAHGSNHDAAVRQLYRAMLRNVKRLPPAEQPYCERLALQLREATFERSPLSRSADDAYVKGHFRQYKGETDTELIERGLEEGQRRMQWILNKVGGRTCDVLAVFDLQFCACFSILDPRRRSDATEQHLRS